MRFRLVPMSACAVVLACVASLRAQPTSRPAARSASESQPVLEEARISRVRLETPGRATPSFYWLHRPAGHGPGQKAPLLICLHGTDDTAGDAIEFWAGRRALIPLLIAAPQGVAPGWRDDDLPTIREMMTHLRRNVAYDPERVFLAGFSAGGAMAFRLLYKEKLPVTAAAALASYVPPSVGMTDVRERADVPVFYAVGMKDVNHERMRSGLDLLRTAGGNVNLYRPEIGHVLDPSVAQAAMDWFFEEARKRIAAIIEAAAADRNVERACLVLEDIRGQTAWQEPGQVELAASALARVEAPVRAELDAARRLINERRFSEAHEALLKIASACGRARVGVESGALARGLMLRPEAASQITERAGRKRADEAMSLYAAAQRSVAASRYKEAMTQCERIIDGYPETPAARRARYLLDLLRTKVPLE